jgi:hypothetical protein
MSDAILEKVRKVLAKAEDPATTPEEAESYTAKAAELIAAYGIDRALLAQADPGSDVVGDRVIELHPPYALDKAGLLAAVAIALRCQAVRRQDPAVHGKQITVHLFGFASDLERAEVLFTSLLLQASGQLVTATVPPWESAAAFRRSWLAGFTAAVAERLRDAERRAEQAAAQRTPAAAAAGPSAPAGARSLTLVLADRGDQVQSAVQATYPRLRAAPRRALSGSGGRDGRAAGQRADLGGARFGRSTRRSLPA